MKERSVLVTGGCGFIGSNLVRLLLPLGGQVRILDDLSGGRIESLAGLPAEIVQGDIRDPAAARRAMEGVRVVIHLAAHGGVVPANNDPAHNLSVNVQGTLNLLLAAKDARVERFIFASSNAIFGDVEPPVDETMRAAPLSPYGAGKLAGEAYCVAFHRTYGLPTCSLRFGHVYGPYSDQKTSVVAAFMKNLLEGEKLTIFGDGNQTRDFVFVEDLCQALILASEATAAGEVFQIANGEENSIRQLATIMCRLAGRDESWIVHAPPRPGEAYRVYSNIEKARRVLGYAPKVTLEEGVKKTYDWYVSNRSRLTGTGR